MSAPVVTRRPHMLRSAVPIAVVGALLVSTALPTAAPAAAVSTCGDGTQITVNGLVACEQRLLASGSWTVPTGVTTADVVVVGGGGGGAGSIGPGYTAGNGGGGGYVTVETGVAVAGSVAVTIGAGGAGGPADQAPPSSNGSDGGASSFGAVTAAGGTGGQGNTRNGALGNGGTSGRTIEGSAATAYGVGGNPLRRSFATGFVYVTGGGGWGAGGPGAGAGANAPWTTNTLDAIPTIAAGNDSSSDGGMGGNGLRPTQGLFANNVSTYFGGGGGGGSSFLGGYGGVGGYGGGGEGGWRSRGTNAAPNTGGGGGGAGTFYTPAVAAPAGVGGSGVVVVRWVPAPTVITASLPDATADALYEQPLRATGGAAPYTWSVTSGSLPAGLDLDPKGAIVGIPTADGTSIVEFTVTDSRGGTGSVTLSLTSIVPVRITTSSLPQGVSDGATTYGPATMTATGSGTLTWAASGLPAGLTIDPSTGVISGTIDSSVEPGVIDVTVTVTNGPLSDSRVLALGVDGPAPLEITTSASLPAGTVGSDYEALFEATGPAGPYTWAVSAGSLPGGLALGTDGVLNGTPTTSGTFSFTVEATSAGPQTATLVVTLVIRDALAISSTSLPSVPAGNAYSTALTATGGDGSYQWFVISGSLPDGLSLTTDGTISGTVAPGASAGMYTVTVWVVDGEGAFEAADLSIEVTSPVSITTPSLPNGTEGSAYSAGVDVAGGVGPYTWYIEGPYLPGELALDPGTGLITGTPQVTGTFTISFAVQDSYGQVAYRDVSLVLKAASGGGSSSDSSTPDAVPDATPAQSSEASTPSASGEPSTKPGKPSATGKVVRVRTKIYFAANSATLSAEARAAIRKLAKKVPARALVRISATGLVQPTSNSSNDTSLSRARAKAVVTALEQDLPTGVKVDSEAIAGGKATTGGAKARRVDLTVSWRSGK